MKVKYIYSACIVIETPDCRICCDPWFSQGIYDGSWYQYPRVEDPVAAIGGIDFAYISHIHPDHYDPQFLRILLEKNPSCVVIVGSENQNFLISKMRRDGFDPVSIGTISAGRTEIGIFPNNAHGEVDIDSALAVKSGDVSIVNMNDCAFDEVQVQQIKEFCGGDPDLACLPYAGAGPYPQMYEFESEDARSIAMEQKKNQFVGLFGRYLTAFKPRFAMPFAGLYYLGGTLRLRNEFRGVPDALEIKKQFGDSVLVLKEGVGEIDLINDDVKNPRTEFSNAEQRDRYLAQFDEIDYPYVMDPEVDLADVKALLETSHRNAVARIHDLPTRWMCFRTFENSYLCVHADNPGVVMVRDSVVDLKNREVITIDSRLLHGLLTRKFHWNNAEIGSHFSFYRDPDTFDRRVYDLLNFLHV